MTKEGWRDRIRCYEIMNGVECSMGTRDRLRREWEHDQLAEALRTQAAIEQGIKKDEQQK